MADSGSIEGGLLVFLTEIQDGKPRLADVAEAYINKYGLTGVRVWDDDEGFGETLLDLVKDQGYQSPMIAVVKSNLETKLEVLRAGEYPQSQSDLEDFLEGK